MTLARVIQWLGAALAYSILGFILYGVWRGTRRQAGRTTGRTGHLLRSIWFYLASVILFFSIAYFAWIPLPGPVTPKTLTWMIIIGSLFYFPGMLFTLWARLTLGRNYFVSTGFGAQLFADHELVITGPYAIVRHPMYSGLMLAAIGALLIYFTWTTLFFAVCAPLTAVRARNEERALQEEFGKKWQDYCNRVPAFFPRFRKESHA